MSALRSLLFAPANHPRRVEKAFTLGADAVILDLEDACAVSEKVASRAKVCEVFAKPRRCKAYVRVNALETEFSYGDIVGTVGSGLDGIVLPKAESAGDIATACWLIAQIERERGVDPGATDLIPIIETARGISNIASILDASARVKRVAFGAGDFTLDLSITWSSEESELLAYRGGIVAASRAAGKEPPIDTVWVRLNDADGFAASARRGHALGFQGKLCIHPNQVDVVNRVFTPSEEAVHEARRIVEAFTKAEAEGSSSIQLDGQFIDYPIVFRAQRILALAEGVEAADNPDATGAS